MKALTLTQPWATLVAIGAKRIETRSWSTNYRGRLAIHAAKGFPREARMFAYQEPAGRVLNEAGISLGGDCRELPTGAIVAVAILRQVWPTGHGFWQRNSVRDNQAAFERVFGNYDEGRYGWLLCDVQRLVKPTPCKGALGLWTVPAEIEQQIQSATKIAA
jgi:activating signal cointegrator 1